MDVATVTALAAAIPQIIIAFAVLVQVFRTRAEVAVTRADVAEVRKDVDGRFSQLIELIKMFGATRRAVDAPADRRGAAGES